jgi:hypothetical protein
MKNYLLLGSALISAHLSLAQNSRSKAEVFLQIEDRGNFTVYLNDDLIGSSSGRFRFYEVYSPTVNLSIMQGDKKILSRQIAVRSNERLLLNFSLRQGLRTIKYLNIYRNGQYALNDFDGYAGSYNTGVVGPILNNQKSETEIFIEQVRKEAFDDDKLKLLQLQTSNIRLTTAQTASLLQSFLKDENKLIAVKSLSRSIVDPQNLYVLKDSFTFGSGKEEFLAYLDRGATNSNRQMTKRDFEQLLISVKKEAFDDQKTKVIQAAAQLGLPNTAQVAELIKVYTFDDKALVMAKMLYPIVSDPQRYYTLKDNFKFISNRDAFIDFLGRQ